MLEEKDGSLGTHLRKLEDASYLEIDKTFRARRPAPGNLVPTDKLPANKHLDRHIENLTRLIGRVR